MILADFAWLIRELQLEKEGGLTGSAGQPCKIRKAIRVTSSATIMSRMTSEARAIRSVSRPDEPGRGSISLRSLVSIGDDMADHP
jgi:hypothetical protein